VSDGPSYWKNLRELDGRKKAEGTSSNEFASGVTDEFSVSEIPEVSRRRFLALLSASAAFAAAGCSDYRDIGEIVPYTKKPEEVTPGIPNYYASTCSSCPQSCGILIKTREGRPIKVDGNDEHPINRGKLCPRGQANILNMYDPNRLRSPQRMAGGVTFTAVSWEEADADVLKSLRNSVQSGKEIAIIARGIHSPTTRKVLDDFRTKYPTAKVYSYSLFNDEARRRAWRKCYGASELSVIEWTKAEVIVALESDFLGTEGMAVEQIAKFAAGRDVMKSKNFNRLYCIEGTMSLTGANSDYRLRLNPACQYEFIRTLASMLGANDLPAGRSPGDFAATYGVSQETLRHLADDLKRHRGTSIIVAGSILPEEVHVAVNYLNDYLGNAALYSSRQLSTTVLPLSSPADFAELVSNMNAGKVGVVIHFDSNPVYHLAPELGYQNALQHVQTSVGLVGSDNETSARCTYALPIHHAFESWGDFKIRTGVLSLQQPVIAPLYNTRQKESILLRWTHEPAPFKETAYHEYLKARWEEEVFPSFKLAVDFKKFWYSSLHDGAVEFPEKVDTKFQFKKEVLPTLGSPDHAGGFTVALLESYYLGDGEFSNNGWLQELPHPISQIAWDNYAAISPASAQKLGVEEKDVIEVRLPQGSIELPVFLQPGHADDFISVALGYGRTNAGPVGNGVGVDTNLLLVGNSLAGARLFSGAVVRKAGRRSELASTQQHHRLNDPFTKDAFLKRGVIREGTVEQYQKNPSFLHKETGRPLSIVAPVQYKGPKWAMAIDLNRCVGCNACVAACNVENNIPVVGKEQVIVGREMQWIRIDRYYTGTDESPMTSHQPMLCQQCDNAPCENVCPTAATNHSPDGLNQMVYNRCVGTKYCSNNCPYKVRRFNFLNWRDNLHDGYYLQEPINLMENPEVTVRARGVMEKCTFCIQRIMVERQHAIEQGREVKGSNVKTACQEACPASAIVFGDMQNPDSEVSRYRAHDIGYRVLEEINVRPNITYLTRLRNVDNE
jgi:Fe-S-cluster-containing dehydrogenase component/anaerobic selenocysteine-containing dehydrogenase